MASVQHMGLAIRQSLGPLAGFIVGCPEFKPLTTIINSQLVVFLPVGVFNPVMPYLDYLFLWLLFEWRAL